MTFENVHFHCSTNALELPIKSGKEALGGMTYENNSLVKIYLVQAMFLPMRCTAVVLQSYREWHSENCIRIVLNLKKKNYSASFFISGELAVADSTHEQRASILDG